MRSTPAASLLEEKILCTVVRLDAGDGERDRILVECATSSGSGSRVEHDPSCGPGVAAGMWTPDRIDQPPIVAGESPRSPSGRKPANARHGSGKINRNS